LKNVFANIALWTPLISKSDRLLVENEPYGYGNLFNDTWLSWKNTVAQALNGSGA
jgi:hypothetical protein